MTVAELVQALSDLPANMRVVIVHSDWDPKKITVDTKKEEVIIA